MDKIISLEQQRKTKVKLNLQQFADSGDKTEKATAKKREESRKKGQVLQSRELSSTLVLTICFVCLKLFGNYMYKETTLFFTNSINEYIKIDDFTSMSEITRISANVILEIIKIIGPILGITMIAGVFLSYIQVGSLFTFETIKPKFSKLSPINGLKIL